MGNRGSKRPCAFDTLFTKSVPHILEKIFFSLDYESFKASMEVNNSWNKLLTSESFKKMGESVFQECLERELHQASEDGNLKGVKIILSRFMVDVNCIRESYDHAYDETPLIKASRKGHKDVVQLLLDRGADANKGNESTALHAAVFLGHKDVVQLLIDRGADPNRANNFGFSSLRIACGNGRKDVLQILLHRGLDLNDRDHIGYAPLYWAVCSGHKDVIQLLLDNGADPNKADRWGTTPLSIAVDRSLTDIVNILKNGHS